MAEILEWEGVPDFKPGRIGKWLLWTRVGVDCIAHMAATQLPVSVNYQNGLVMMERRCLMAEKIGEQLFLPQIPAMQVLVLIGDISDTLGLRLDAPLV